MTKHLFIIGSMLISTAALADPPAPAPPSSNERIGTVLVHGQLAVIVKRFQLDFLDLPSGISIDIPKSQTRPMPVFMKDGKPVELNLKPKKSLSFKFLVDIRPTLPEQATSSILICSNLVYRPINERGRIGPSCGILSMSGEVLYEFPLQQNSPSRLLKPLRLADDGSWAAVFLGRKIGDEDGPSIGRPREVWIWRKETGLEKFPARSKNPLVRNLLQYFRPEFLEGENG